MSDKPKTIPLEEFQALGFLQEVNRRVLHPAGLALQLTVDAEGAHRFRRILDMRDGEGGHSFEELNSVDRAKAENVQNEINHRAKQRLALWGQVEQPFE